MLDVNKIKIDRCVTVDGLGICSQCGGLNFSPSPQVSVERDEHKCPDCGRLLAAEDFGYVVVKKKTFESDIWRRTRWVGKEGEWVGRKPRGNFILGGYYLVMVRRLPARLDIIRGIMETLATAGDLEDYTDGIDGKPYTPADMLTEIKRGSKVGMAFLADIVNDMGVQMKQEISDRIRSHNQLDYED